MKTMPSVAVAVPAIASQNSRATSGRMPNMPGSATAIMATGTSPAVVLEPVFRMKTMAPANRAAPLHLEAAAHKIEPEEAETGHHRTGDVLVREHAAPKAGVLRLHARGPCASPRWEKAPAQAS